jgi:hypothetical protein
MKGDMEHLANAHLFPKNDDPPAISEGGKHEPIKRQPI